MCWAYKFCVFIPLDLAGLFIGIGNIIFSVITTIASTTIIVLQKYHVNDSNQHILQHIFDTDMNKAVIDLVVILALISGTLGIPFSTFLVIGVHKAIPNLILSYFVYGVVVTIICFLAALLELIHRFWIIAVIKVLLCLFFIHILVVVHTIYELMCRGKIFGRNNDSLMEEEADWDSNLDT